jgi:hypothetical protein
MVGLSEKQAIADAKSKPSVSTYERDADIRFADYTRMCHPNAYLAEHTVTWDDAERNEAFNDTIGNIIDDYFNQPYPYTLLAKIQNCRMLFDIINKRTVEELTQTGIEDDYCFLSTAYTIAVSLTCDIVERSYTTKCADDEKNIIIRTLSAMLQTWDTVSRILWNARLEDSVHELMNTGDRHSEQLYRCLKHIASDESEAHDYEIQLYDDGLYEDVELYDWYLLRNFGCVAKEDIYVRNADVCFGENIRVFNPMLWH